MYFSLNIVVNGNKIIDPVPNLPNPLARFESGLIDALNLKIFQK